MAKRMTAQEVWQVKMLICKGYSQVEVARAVGVSSAQISRICLGDAHRNVEWPNPIVGERMMRDRRTREGELSGWYPVGVPEAVVTQDIIDRGEAKPPEYLPPAPQVVEMNEEEAVEQARKKIDDRAEMKKEIYRRIDLQHQQEEKEFLEAMSPPEGAEPDPNDPAKMPSIWEVNFIPWEEVQERAKDNSIIEAAEGKENEIVQRAIGIVFFTTPKEEWEDNQTIRKIAAVAEQLRKSQSDAN